MFPAFEREPGSTGSHPHRPETHREKSVCRSSSAENMGPPPPQDRVTHLLQAFPSPANGVHLPADLPLLLIGQDGVERPRIRTAVPGTGDLRARKQNKIHQRNDKNSLHHSVTEQGPHLSSCGVIAPLDVELWRGRERWTLKLKDILAALEAHDCDSVAVLVRTSAVRSMLFTSSMYAFISAL